MFSRQKFLLGVLLLSLPVGAVSCSSNKPVADATPTGWVPVPEAELSAEQVRQKERAVAAREALFGALMARLGEVVSKEGPAAAVEVCQVEASQIAQAKSAELGVRIGRTSDRLRNPNNQPPEWAKSTLASRPENPVFFRSPEGKLGALLPIRLKQPCLTCHGSPEQIPAAVREQLTKHYPQDKATGYAENDLRGWFWVEVPPQQQ